jgi:glycosyltransferase involved in cell wall biosynthesis
MHKDAPKVSIIMPCHNAAAHLPVSIGSVLAQTFSGWELIAVDDGSADGTLAWLREQDDPRIRVHTQTNNGVSAARNAGLAMARSDYVAFLDSDDIWAPDFLSQMLEAIQADPEIGLVYCGWQNVGVPGPRGEPFVPPDYESAEKIPTLLASNRWPIHACLTRLDLVTAVGGFDTHFAVGEDFLLWLEISCFHKIKLVPKVLAYYVHHVGLQATRNRVRAARQLRDVQETFLRRHPIIVDELGRTRIRELTDGMLLARAYDAYWKRDLVTAQPIFRMALRGGGWGIRDLRYLLPSFLPGLFYQKLVSMVDSRSQAKTTK